MSFVGAVPLWNSKKNKKYNKRLLDINMEQKIKAGDFVRLTDPISNDTIVRIESVDEYGFASWLGGIIKSLSSNARNYSGLCILRLVHTD